MLRDAISAFTRVSTRYVLRRGAPLIRGPWHKEGVVPALRSSAKALHRVRDTKVG